MDTEGTEYLIKSKYLQLQEHAILRCIIPTKLGSCYEAWYKYYKVPERFVSPSYVVKIIGLHSYIEQIFNLIYDKYCLLVALIHANGMYEELETTLRLIDRFRVSDMKNYDTIISLLISEESDKLIKITELLQDFPRSSEKIDIVPLILRYLDYDIEPGAFSVSTEDIKVVHFNPNSGVRLEMVLNNLYNGMITGQLINQLKTLMFRVKSNIMFYNGFEIIKFIDPINTKRKFWFEGMRYTVLEFLLVHLFIYSGIVDEEGPTIIHRKGLYYVNVRNLNQPKRLIGPTRREPEEIINSFLHNVSELRFSSLITKPYILSEELYNLYLFYCKEFSIQPVKDKTFFKRIKGRYNDISNRNKVKLTKPSIGELVRSNISESNNLCFYVYRGIIPNGTRSIKLMKEIEAEYNKAQAFY